MSRDIDIANAARKLSGEGYCLGDASRGLDCLTLLWHFFGELGVDLPREFKDFNEKTYAERWRAGEGRDVFLEYLMSLGVPVEFNYMTGGDVIAFRYGVDVFAGVYLGSGNMLCAFEKGVMVSPVKFFRDSVEGVRRCLPY